MVELPPRASLDIDRRIAAHAERIPDGATLRSASGAVPNAVLAQLDGHRDLASHELFRRRRRPGPEKRRGHGHAQAPHRNKIIATSALGTQRLFDSSPRTPGSSSGRSTTPTTRA
jgi:acyl-CoA hydrolase